MYGVKRSQREAKIEFSAACSFPMGSDVSSSDDLGIRP